MNTTTLDRATDVGPTTFDLPVEAGQRWSARRSLCLIVGVSLTMWAAIIALAIAIF